MRAAPFLLLLAATQVSAAPLDGAGQLVVVRAPSWDARGGTLRRYQRQDGKWVEQGKAVPVSLGGKGLAWGTGVAPATADAPPGPGPVKKEGDTRTPAGVFKLTGATGAAATPPAGTRLPYTQADDALVCVDDGASAHYNQLARKTGAGDDWKSSEPMLHPPIYEWVILVDHNPERKPGGGSCIFLHLERKPGSTTLGCTAMPKTTMEELLPWLDPAKAPLFVALPEDAYTKLQKRWGLP